MTFLQNSKWQEKGVFFLFLFPVSFIIIVIIIFPNSFGKHAPSRHLKAFLASDAASVNTGNWCNLQ